MLDFDVSWIFQSIWTSFENIHKHLFGAIGTLKKNNYILAESSSSLHEAYIYYFFDRFLLVYISKEMYEHDP